MSVVVVDRGDSPVILAQPHGGTDLPPGLLDRMTAQGRALADTDWHIDRLYDGLLPGATRVRATLHRYVIDMNRDPAGGSLYPGQNTTALCPTTDFDGRDLWQAGQAPGADEIAQRCAAYHAPYHAALADEIARVRARHGVAIVYDCHSIRSKIPFLFDGILPVFNVGTDGGTTCAPAVEAAMFETCRAARPDDSVLNGRFRGGWTTRHYGQPAQGVHAIQMETAQRAYMTERPPWTYLDAPARATRATLSKILHDLDHLARSGALHPKGDPDA
ncbi:MAG: N-formylglutamate deformylase [Marinibacterium sp.]|nr:N-formylglutamate deformylase [Marinibacterium sp.]